MKFSLALLYATESFTTTVLCEMRSATDALKCSNFTTLEQKYAQG